MKSFRISSTGKASYTVTLDDHGIADVDGLLPATAEMLKMTVRHYMDTYKMPLLLALGKAIGPYATAEEIDAETSVSDLL